MEESIVPATVRGEMESDGCCACAGTTDHDMLRIAPELTKY